jgi:thiol:disulfide interchange protein DsbD
LTRIIRGPTEELPIGLSLSLRWQLCYDNGICLFPESRQIPIQGSVQSAGAGEVPENLILVLFLAFLGGLILNVMPCVLPVLSLKVLALAQAAGDSPGRKRLHALATVLGIVVSLLVLALILIILQGAGSLVGWGFQFQQPLFTAFMVLLLVSFALNLLGVWQIGAPSLRQNVGQKQKSILTSFGNGLLTVVLATPCSAPFLGTAMGVALGAPWWVILLSFLMVGLGLALPFFLLATIPGATRWIPKPGAWMERFRHIMGFALLATAIWMVTVYGQQVGFTALSGLLWIGLALSGFWWVMGQLQMVALRPIWKWTLRVLALSGMILVLATNLQWPWQAVENSNAPSNSAAVKEPWQPFVGNQVEADMQSGKPVFVVFSASWCLTCQVNEAGVLSDPEILEALVAAGVGLYKGDWTSPNAEIEAWLRRYQRAGVPFYLLSLPGKPVQILPEILDKELILGALQSLTES